MTIHVGYDKREQGDWRVIAWKYGSYEKQVTYVPFDRVAKVVAAHLKADDVTELRVLHPGSPGPR